MPHSISYYLEKGFEPAYAEYFAKGRRTICAVKPNDDLTLTLTFDNNEIRCFDVKPIIQSGTIYEILKDLPTFKRVYLDEDHVVCWDIDPKIDSKIHWNNKIDISPDTCYVESFKAES